MAIEAAKRKLHVAVYGSGIACDTLIQALKEFDHLYLQYFVADSKSTEDQESLFSIEAKGRNALALIGEDASRAIERAAGYTEEPSKVSMGSGHDSGTSLFDRTWVSGSAAGFTGLTLVHTSSFLKGMLKDLNHERIFRDKKLVSIKHSNSEVRPLELCFEDGTTKNVDVLLGDDGLTGTMRAHILGKEHSSTKPEFTGFCTVSKTNSTESKQANPHPIQRIDNVGRGVFLTTSPHASQAIFYSDGASTVSGTPHISTPSELVTQLGNFPNCTRVAASLAKSPVHAELVHPHAPTYINGLTAMLGNSAHTMPSFHYQYAVGQSIEDAMVLGALLGEAKDVHGLEAALYGYDCVRIQRSQWVSDQVVYLGKLMCGLVDGVGLEVEPLKQALAKWHVEWDEVDVKDERRQGLRIMRERLWMAGYAESMFEDEDDHVQ